MGQSKRFKRCCCIVWILPLCVGCTNATFPLRDGAFALRSGTSSVAGRGASSVAGGGPAPVATPPVHAEPTLTGSRLGLRQGETATERALELTEKLADAEQEKSELSTHIKALEASLREKDIALSDATAKARSSHDELARIRADAAQSKSDALALCEKLRVAEISNLSTLESTVTVLQRALDQTSKDRPGGAATSSGSARTKQTTEK